MGKPWIGVDFDGTLSNDTHEWGLTNTGKPIIPMVKRIRKLLAEGKTVKIFTARVDDSIRDEKQIAGIKSAIEAWCLRWLGQKLEITNKKDFNMIYCYDDRCVQVERNTGKIIGEDWYD